MFRIHYVLTFMSTIAVACVLQVVAGETAATTQLAAPTAEADKVDRTVFHYLDTLSSRKVPDPGKSDKTIVVFGSAQLSTDPPMVSGRQTTQPATQPASVQDGSTLELAPITLSGDNVQIMRAQDKSGSEIGPITIRGKQLQINGMSVAADKNGAIVIVDGRNTLTAKHVKLGEASLTADQNGDVLILDDLKQLSLTYTPKDQNSTYLGVGVEPPSDALRSQLNLAPGGGLLVNYIDEAGPSKSVLQKHDVLQKLDDQILINPEQLIALIHMHSPGDSVTLTFLRQASPRTERITLGRKAPLPQIQTDIQYNSSQFLPTEMSFLFPRRDGAITYSDGELNVSLDGTQNLSVTDSKTGSIVFQGPTATPEQWEKVPAHIREKLAEWRDMVGPKKEASAPPAAVKP